MQGIRRLIVVSAAFVICGTEAQAQQSPVEGVGRRERLGRIGIGIIGPAGLPADLRIRLEDAAAAGLRASGADVVSAVELSRARQSASLGTCSDTLCEQRLAQVTDTRYWLRGTCQLDTSTYRLHLELVDARSGAVVVARDDTCDICTEADAAETVNVAASALKAALGRAPQPRPTNVAAASLRPATSGVVAGQTPIKIDGNTNAHPTGREAGASSHTDRDNDGDVRPLWQRLLPWGAFVSAAAFGAAGTYYLAINNQGFECGGVPKNCRLYNDTTWQWVPLLAVSAAFATVGVVLLTVSRGDGDREARASREKGTSPPSTVQLGLSVGGVTARGTF